MDLTLLREGYFLINEPVIQAFLGEDPAAISTLLKTQNMLQSYFPKDPFFLVVDTRESDGFQQLITYVQIYTMDHDEAVAQLESFDREWWVTYPEHDRFSLALLHMPSQEQEVDTGIEIPAITDQFEGVYTLLNREELGTYLGEHPEYSEPLLRAQKVVQDYFPHNPLSLSVDPQNLLDYRPFSVAIHPPKKPHKMNLVEAFQRLNFLYQEWGIDPLESMVVIGFTPYSFEEHKEQLYAHTA